MTTGRAAIAAELAVGTVALATNLSHAVLPAGARTAVNVGTAGASLAIARRSGASWSALGLDRDRVLPGLLVGLGAAAVLAGAVVVASRVPALAPRFADEGVAAHGRGRAAFELVARIPLETAVSEEVIFRGALLGTALAGRSAPAAVASTSALFGLWHIVPTVGRLEGSAVGAAVGPSRFGRVAGVAATVGVTAAAGVAFSALRLRSRSLVAPMVGHAALNMATFAVARRAGRRTDGPVQRRGGAW